MEDQGACLCQLAAFIQSEPFPQTGEKRRSDYQSVPKGGVTCNRVVQVSVYRNRQVGRDGPRSGGPDHEPEWHLIGKRSEAGSWRNDIEACQQSDIEWESANWWRLNKEDRRDNDERRLAIHTVTAQSTETSSAAVPTTSKPNSRR